MTADDRKPPSKRAVSRRALLGWCISGGAAALLVAVFVSIHDTLSDIPALAFWRSKRTGHAGRQPARLLG